MRLSSRRRAVVLGLAAGLTATLATASLGYWARTASGTGTATAGSVNAPTGVGVTPATKLVSWTTSAAGGGAIAPQSYLVERSPDTTPGDWTTTACTAAAGATSCTDAAAIPTAAGTYAYRYRVTAIYKTWTAVSGETAAVTYTVANAVTVTGGSPNARAVGLTNQDIVITGTGFASGAQATFSGSNITVVSTTFNSATSVTARISIASNATTGTRDITVTNSAANGGGSGTCTGCFSLNAQPAITTTSPTSALPHNGTSTTVTVNGSGFQSGFTATTSDTKYVVTGTAFISTAQVTVTIRNDYTNNGTNSANLTVTNADGGSATKNGALTN